MAVSRWVLYLSFPLKLPPHQSDDACCENDTSPNELCAALGRLLHSTGFAYGKIKTMTKLVLLGCRMDEVAGI